MTSSPRPSHTFVRHAGKLQVLFLSLDARHLMVYCCAAPRANKNLHLYHQHHVSTVTITTGTTTTTTTFSFEPPKKG